VSHISSGIEEVDTIRAKLVERSGGGGMRGLVRVLRIMDENGNRNLSKEEFFSGLSVYGLHFDASQNDTIFSYFDRDRSGQIDITEFVRDVRGDMSQERTALILQVYDLLDQNTDGTVTFNDLKKCYDVSKHPKVLAGEITPQQALMEFMKGWDKNGDGTVTREEFIEYYNDISACIDDDRYFELMIRNAWHLYGGSGASANTSNLRVLVIHTDGTQTVEVLQNDLGVRRTDTAKITERLKQQGINDVRSVSAIGGV